MRKTKVVIHILDNLTPYFELMKRYPGLEIYLERKKLCNFISRSIGSVLEWPSSLDTFQQDTVIMFIWHIWSHGKAASYHRTIHPFLNDS